MSKGKIILGVVVVIIVLAAIGAYADRGAGAADAKNSATVAGNVRDTYATEIWYGAIQQTAGLPNVQVIASTVFVFTHLATGDLGNATAMTICQGVAAVTNDPNTAQPLGLRHVEVDGGTGNDKLATCDVP